MALKTNLIEKRRVVGCATRKRYALDVQIRSFDQRSQRSADQADWIGLSGVWVVAVGAFDVTPHRKRILCGVVYAGAQSSGVVGAFADVGGDVEGRNGTAVTIKAVILLAKGSQQPLRPPGGMDFVAIDASVVGYGCVLESFIGIDDASRRSLPARRVGRMGPAR